MKNYIKIPVHGEVAVIECENTLDAWYKEIGCRSVEVVHPMFLGEPHVMICDEEGLLEDNPVVNVAASVLYGTLAHGQPICGNVLVAQEVETPDGMDLTGYNLVEIQEVLKRIVNIFLKGK